MIFIADGQKDTILGHIKFDQLLENEHEKSKEDWLEIFTFKTFADQSFSEHLTKRNKILIPDEDGELIEFTLFEVIKRRDGGLLVVECYSRASYQDLKKSKSLVVGTTDANSAETHLSNALNNTAHEVGQVDFKGVRTLSFDNAVNPFNFIKRIASEFELEPRFRVIQTGGRIAHRYVDLIEQVGDWRGRTAEFGRDIETLERKENTENIVTALRCFGPEDDAGNRLVVEVTDDEAFQRWGVNGQHLWDDYEPQSENAEMTESELEGYGRTELNKRISAVTSYQIGIIDLEHVSGMENKKIRFGDTVRVKDTKFVPPLYIEARIYKFNRDIVKKANKKVELGDYTEYTETEVNAIWKSLQAKLREKISLIDLQEVTYTKPEIDQKDESGNAAKDKLDSDVGQAVIETTTGSQTKADQAQSSAESNANNYTNTVKSEIDSDLLDKAGLEYVNGELLLKADSATVQAINNTVNDLETTASDLQILITNNADELEAQDGRITTVSTDLNTVEGSLNATISDLSLLDGTVKNQQTAIDANATAINLKASQDELDTVSGDVSSLSGEVNILAGQVELKAEQSALNSLSDDVTTISNDVSTLTVSVNGISADVSSLDTTVNGHTTNISDLNSQVDIQAGQISTKVESSTFNSLEGRVDSAESTISQQASQINAKAESSKVNAIESRVSSAELDIDGLNGSISTKVEQSTFNNLDGTVDNLSSQVTQTAEDVQFAFEDIDDINSKINNATVTVNGEGVTVENGAFLLVDETSNQKTTVRENSNSISDHSFEYVPPDTVISSFGNLAHIYSVDANWLGGQTFNWWNNTSPANARVMVSMSMGTNTLHGQRSAVLRPLNYGIWEQVVDIPRQFANTQALSLSAYVAAYEQSTFNPVVSMRLQLVDQNGTWIEDLASDTFTLDYTKNYDWQRISVTYKGPISNNEYKIRVRLLLDGSSSSAFCLCDGVQLVPFEYPAFYYPETGLYRLTNGYDTASEIVTEMLSVGNYASVARLYAGTIDRLAHNFISLQNGWSNYGGGFQSARYTRTSTGLVYLSGLVTGGAIGTTIGYLPVGCRPNDTESFSAATYGTSAGKVYVYENGRIEANSGSNYLSLSGICFLAEN